MKCTALQVVVFFALFGIALHAGANPILNPLNGHYFDAISVPEGIDWYDANIQAEAMSFMGVSGYLAVTATPGELDFIMSRFPQACSNLYWLGGFQPEGSPEPAGNWQWVNGEPWSYTNWGSGQPNNYADSEDGLRFSGTSVHWNDISRYNTGSKGFVVEFEAPIPNPVLNLANGHYYEAISASGGITWYDAATQAEAVTFMGMPGHLAAITSPDENGFIAFHFPEALANFYWFGGFQPASSPEPAGNWQWVNGEPWSYNNWGVGEPDNQLGDENSLQFLPSGHWGDISGSVLDVQGFVVEYEPPVPNPILNLANGHYYEAIAVQGGITWDHARVLSEAMNFMGEQGHLATITSQAENDFIMSHYAVAGGQLYWLGGIQAPGGSEPGGSWEWITGESWVYSNWHPNEPNNHIGDDVLQFNDSYGRWNDGLNSSGYFAWGFVVEWEGAGTPPEADFGWVPESQVEGGSVQFTDQSSPANIIHWLWDFGDGSTSEEQNPAHTYANDSTYSVDLTVTWNDGYVDSISHNVTIANIPPQIDIDYPNSATPVYATVQIRANVSDAGGDTLTVSFSVDGDQIHTVEVIGTASYQEVSCNWDTLSDYSDGIHSIEITVYDGTEYVNASVNAIVKNAGLIVEYELDQHPNTGSPLPATLRGDGIGNLSAGDLGLFGASPIDIPCNGDFYANLWPTNDNPNWINPNKYFQFGVSALPGQSFTLTEIVYALYTRLTSSSIGPQSFDLYASTDGFSSGGLGTFLTSHSISGSPNYNHQTIFYISDFNALGPGPFVEVTFRLYGYNSGNASRMGGLSNTLCEQPDTQGIHGFGHNVVIRGEVIPVSTLNVAGQIIAPIPGPIPDVPIDGALLELLLDGNVEYSVTTDSNGEYQLLDIAPNPPDQQYMRRVTENSAELEVLAEDTQVHYIAGVDVLDEEIKIKNYSIVANCPVDLHIYDSEGNHTGLVNGTVEQGIPYSRYSGDMEPEVIVILNPDDVYTTMIVGTEEAGEGEVFDLQINSYVSVDGIDIPATISMQNISIEPDQEIPFTYNYAEIQETVDALVAEGNEVGDAISDAIGSPTVMEITAPADPVCLGESIIANVSFTNPEVADIHTVTWDWGDGEIETQTISITGGFGTVPRSHAYGDPGVYTIALTIADDDGNSDSSEFQYVVVYDPDGGFVTGGGWIISPAGAFMPDPTLRGKAKFGFVSKYKKGATVPTGQTEFNFKVADLNFHSSSYEWLVVAGHKAQYKGIGTVNGSGNYGFKLFAIDEALTPSTDEDLFRIKIWDADNDDRTVYDNQMEDSDDVDPTTAIGGGNIVIHKGSSSAPEGPAEFASPQNYPNPFNPDTWIPYQLPEDVRVTVRLYSAAGGLVRTLRLGQKSAGFYIAKEKAAYWDGRNEAGEQVSSGVYFYTIQAGDFTATQKMVVAK